VSENEMYIISQTLPDLVKMRRTIPPPYPGENMDQYAKFKVEAQQRIDTSNFTLYLKDTLIIPDYKYFPNFPDTEFSGLPKALVSDTLKASPINFDKLRLPFELLKEKPAFKNWNSLSYSFLGYASYSRIIFSNDFNKACFYFELHCGLLCGFGNVYYCEKKDGHWVIFREVPIWIS